MNFTPQADLGIVLMILSLSFHEFAHAFVARRLGDDTAERQGRLTLNPLAHIDVMGTLIVPALGALTGVPLIGWAKPTPVDPNRFRRGVDRRRGHALVSAAGPISNLILALVAIAAMALGGQAVQGNPGLFLLLFQLFSMNVALCVFNLLPIPPLDGSRLTPSSMDGLQRRVAPYSAFVLMALIAEPHLRHYLIEVPVATLSSALGALFGLQL